MKCELSVPRLKEIPWCDPDCPSHDPLSELQAWGIEPVKFIAETMADEIWDLTDWAYGYDDKEPISLEQNRDRVKSVMKLYGLGNILLQQLGELEETIGRFQEERGQKQKDDKEGLQDVSAKMTELEAEDRLPKTRKDVEPTEAGALDASA